jgi:hypothetical protein
MFALLALSPLCLAQSPQPELESIDSLIEIARAEMKVERTALIGAGMNFSEKDGAAFWPIYREYEHERSTLDDLRLAVIMDFAEKYLNLTDDDAKVMAERMFEYDSREAELKRKYFKKFNKALPALTVAQFFQLEHRIDLMMGVKVENSLPAVPNPQ